MSAKRGNKKAKRSSAARPHTLAIDIGGTKTQLILEDLSGHRVLDVTEPSLEWDAEPEDKAALWIAERVKRHTPAGAEIVALAFGAQGINRDATGRTLERELEALGGLATPTAHRTGARHRHVRLLHLDEQVFLEIARRWNSKTSAADDHHDWRRR